MNEITAAINAGSTIIIGAFLLLIVALLVKAIKGD